MKTALLLLAGFAVGGCGCLQPVAEVGAAGGGGGGSGGVGGTGGGAGGTGMAGGAGGASGAGGGAACACPWPERCGVPGGGACALHRFVVFPSTTRPISTTTEPGRPGLASDGTNWLVVTCRRSSTTAPGELVGALVSPTGSVATPFPIAANDCSGSWPSVAFDGTNYLVVYNTSAEVRGVRVSRAGVVLDQNGGFSIGAGQVTGRSVAFGNGGYLVALDRTFDVFGARVSPDGTVGVVFPISQAAGEQVFANVIWLADHFLVGWRDTRTGSGPAAASVITGARVSPEGVVVDPAGFALGTQDGGEDGIPSLSAGAGTALVTWVDTRSGSQFSHDLAASRISADGGRRLTADGGTIALTTGGTSEAGEATSAFDGRGWIAAWSPGGFGMQPEAGLWVSRISPEGVVLDPNGRRLVQPECYACRSVFPNAARGGSGTLVVWVDNSESSSTPKTVQALLLP